EAQPGDPARLPVGGLTVIVFPNNHAVYALTWFALAAMSAYGLIRGVTDRA
ncbi:UNVERIFIED_CONTAM: SURF1 family protein, partial [Bacteroidetes bacterium 56_B9]